MRSLLRPAILLFVVLTLLTGVVYPLAVTGVAQLVFPARANGSLVTVGGKAVGSELIGQSFTSPKYFWGRPSATSPQPYNGTASTGSNFGPTNPALTDAVRDRVAALRAADPDNTAPVPVDLVTASGSGLDPDITVAAAYYQTPRVARERSLAVDAVKHLVDAQAGAIRLGFFGEPTVNVLRLNLALDKL
ncbi:MAG: potassium-transporting ATPase subunit KdpC [Casimicrobiaceae bacterium]